MQRHWNITEPSYSQNIAMIDGDFDLFELNNDLSGDMHNADIATFYHDSLDLEE